MAYEYIDEDCILYQILYIKSKYFWTFIMKIYKILGVVEDVVFIPRCIIKADQDEISLKKKLFNYDCMTPQ